LLQRRAVSVAILFCIFAFILFSTHFKLISLPFFWDEAGQFVSQAQDLYQGGGLIPKSAMPNSHPPGLPLLLAGAWKLFGYSIPLTRSLMLLFGAAFLTVSFLLAVELLKGARGVPAFAVAALLLANPLVYTQSMMAQLDLPSALFTTILLLAYLMKLEMVAVVAAVLSVAFKETSIGIPLVLGVFAWREGRRQFAAQLVLGPVLVVVNWVAYVWFSTGRLFGDAAYTEYNMLYPLHPVRLGYAILRRVSYLGIENLHILPLGVLIWRWKQVGFDQRWRPVAAACVAHVLLVSVTGGAVLERYLLPVLPVLYAAFAAGMSTLAGKWRHGVLALSCAGLITMLFVNPPWPFALENNLAMVDLVEAQRNAAGFVESGLSRSRITTTWPLTDALRKPYLGYVEEPIAAVRAVEDLSIERLKGLDWERGDVLILYARAWDPSYGLARWPWVRELLRKYFRFADEAGLRDVTDLPGLRPLVGFEQRGFWVEILVVP
jgi:hypothetical protein